MVILGAVGFLLFLNLSSLFSHDSHEKTTSENFSPYYMLGAALSRNISEYDFDAYEIGEIIKGFSDGLNRHTISVDYDKINQMIKEKKEVILRRNKAKGEEYLKKLMMEKNSTLLENGIVYIKRVGGKGPTPSDTDTVKVHYRGIFIDGTEFDSSYKRNQPAEFKLSSVIQCWRKALVKMRVGEKATIGCPSDVAYGDIGIERVIPPGSTLIFDVELIDIVKDDERNAQQKKK